MNCDNIAKEIKFIASYSSNSSLVFDDDIQVFIVVIIIQNILIIKHNMLSKYNII